MSERHVRLLVELLRRLQRRLLQPLLARGGEITVGNVVPREFDGGGSRRLRRGMRVWYAVLCHGVCPFLEVFTVTFEPGRYQLSGSCSFVY